MNVTRKKATEAVYSLHVSFVFEFLLMSAFLFIFAAAVPAYEGVKLLGGPAKLVTGGSYLITADITVTTCPTWGTEQSVFRIEADGVELDFGGHTVTAPSGCPIVQIAGTVADVVIKRGKIVGGSYGVLAQFTSPTKRGFFRIRDMDFSSTTTLKSAGIKISSTLSAEVRVLVSKCRFTNISGNAITLENIDAGRILENTIDGVNSVSAPDGYGIYFTGTNILIQKNTIRSCASAGIYLDSAKGVDVSNNVIHSCSPGIQVNKGGQNNIYRNVITRSTTDGILVTNSSGNSIDWNTLTYNGDATSGTGYGIHFDSLSANNMYSNNRIIGNYQGDVWDESGQNADAGGNCTSGIQGCGVLGLQQKIFLKPVEEGVKK